MRSGILWPNRSVKPPYGSVEVDWAHPLAQGLVFYSLLRHGEWALTQPGWHRLFSRVKSPRVVRVVRRFTIQPRTQW